MHRASERQPENTTGKLNGKWIHVSNPGPRNPKPTGIYDWGGSKPWIAAWTRFGVWGLYLARLCLARKSHQDVPKKVGCASRAFCKQCPKEDFLNLRVPKCTHRPYHNP